MFSQEVSLLVTCLLTVAVGIRVDWGTNKGPIVPPTPRPIIVPLPPYRAPAPVWEDQSNDIPNPNPYVYVPPPTSRPRYNNPDSNNNNYNYNFGMLIPPAPPLPQTNGVNIYYQQASTVASLAPKYVPGVGIQYYAVVPTQANAATQSSAATSGGYYSGNSDKLQGKYNAKTKKHKAYEKFKYANNNNYQNNSNNNEQYNNQAATKSPQNIEKTLETSQMELQQLPVLTAPQPFQKSHWNIAQNTETTPNKISWKWKRENDDFVHKQQKKRWIKSDYSNEPNAIQS